MTTLYVPTGRPKNELIDRAYAKCGLAGYEFERTPEEMGDGLRELNVMMMEKPWSLLGFNLPAQGDGDLTDQSGLLDSYVPAVVMELALRLCPQLGKSLSAEAVKVHSRAVALLRAELATTPAMKLRGGVYAGSGRRGAYGRGTLYTTGE